MTNTPDRKIEYKTAGELEQLYVQFGFEGLLKGCKQRAIVDTPFEFGKEGHWTTVHELGEVFTDATGVRAVIFHYTHSNQPTIRSIKRLVTDDTDYRIPVTNASPPM